MATFPLVCANCRAAIHPALAAPRTDGACPECGAAFHVAVFPALFREIRPGAAGGAVVLPDEAGCFDHPASRAEAVCDSCGRFMCALCDIQHEGGHLCAPCFQAGIEKDPAASGGRVTRYDLLALSLVVIPLVPPLVFFTTYLIPLFALPAIFAAVLSLRRPRGLVPRVRWRPWAAIVLALIELAAWLGFAGLMVYIGTLA